MVWDSIDSTVIMGAIALAIAAHLVFAVFALRFSVVFMLAGLLLLLSPISIASNVPMVGLVKIARIYVSVMIVVAGLPRAFRQGIGPAGRVTIALGCIYFIGLLYSSQPVAGFQFKALVLLNLICGVVLAESVPSLRDLIAGLHLLLISSIVFVVFMFVGVAFFNAGAGGTRISPFGINANAIASAAAANMAICTYLACYDESRLNRWVAWITAGFTGVIVVSTGSRTGVVSTVIVCGLIFLPLVRRPGRFIVALAVIGIFGLALSQLVDVASSEHLLDIANTREEVWSNAMQSFQTNIMIGPGWASSMDATIGIQPLNAHSIFLQMLAEMGLFGFTTLIVTILFLLRQIFIVRRATIDVLGTPVVYFALALLLTPILVGFFENGLFSSSSTQGVFFGFAAGLTDRFIGMALLEMSQRAAMAGATVPAVDGELPLEELHYADVPQAGFPQTDVPQGQLY